MSNLLTFNETLIYANSTLQEFNGMEIFVDLGHIKFDSSHDCKSAPALTAAFRMWSHGAAG
jgi:hypothetical protein